METKSKVLSSGMHVAHCTTYRQSPWISPKTALPKEGERIVFVVDQGPKVTDRYWFDIGSMDKHGFTGMEMSYNIETVMLWMSVPELPYPMPVCNCEHCAKEQRPQT